MLQCITMVSIIHLKMVTIANIIFALSYAGWIGIFSADFLCTLEISIGLRVCKSVNICQTEHFVSPDFTSQIPPPR
mgnify:CR=1 FL=1